MDEPGGAAGADSQHAAAAAEAKAGAWARASCPELSAAFVGCLGALDNNRVYFEVGAEAARVLLGQTRARAPGPGR